MAVPNQVVSYGSTLEDSKFTYLISGTVTAADVGKAVALDTSAAKTVKLAGDGDTVFGRLEVYEDRAVLGVKVATVARRFKHLLPIKAGLTGVEEVAVGDTVVGAGGGEVKAADDGATPTAAKAPDPNANTVVELITIGGKAYAAVEKL